MKTLLLILSAVIGCVSSAAAQTKPVLYRQLSRVIDSLAIVDQRPLQIMMRGTVPDTTRARLLADQKARFSRHQQMLEAIVKKYGYPGFEEVGERSSGNFWLLVQHGDAYPRFQRQVSRLMLAEVKRKNASSRNYAYLADRIAENSGRLQVYGTQVAYQGPGVGKAAPRSLRDPKNVNSRRAAIGMEPLEMYLEMNDKRREQTDSSEPPKDSSEPPKF